MKSYAENSDNVIFQTKLCGEIMRSGTVEQDICTLHRLSQRTEIIFIVSLAIIGLNLFIALWVLGFNGCLHAISYFGLGFLFFWITTVAAVAGAFCFGTLGVNVLAVSIFTLAQSIVSSIFIGFVLYNHNSGVCKDQHQNEKGANSNEQFNLNVQDNEETTAGRTAEDPGREAKMKEIVNLNGEDEHKFEVGVWEDEQGEWEESSESEDDYSRIDPNKHIEVQYIPDRRK